MVIVTLDSFIPQFLFFLPLCQSVWWEQVQAFKTPCSCQGEWPEWPCGLPRCAWRWKRFWTNGLLDSWRVLVFKSGQSCFFSSVVSVMSHAEKWMYVPVLWGIIVLGHGTSTAGFTFEFVKWLLLKGFDRYSETEASLVSVTVQKISLASMCNFHWFTSTLLCIYSIDFTGLW